MTEQIVTKRLVFHVGGYDAMPPRAVHQRFARELRRFEGTWSVTASVSPASIEASEASWRVTASGPNWCVETDFHLVRWDDFIAAEDRRPIWRQVPLGCLAFLDFVAGGALWGYLRTNWRYAGFFLYPFVVTAIMAALAALAGSWAAEAARSQLVGLTAGILTLSILLRWPGRQLHLTRLLGDWIFSRAYLRDGDPVLGQRLDAAAEAIATAARNSEADEILVVGHSLGAVLAVDLLDRVLRLNPALGRAGARFAFVAIGSSILKIGLHRSAHRFRAAVARVASAPGVFWAEYQALTDVMNFYKSDPVAVMGLKTARHPAVRVVRLRRMLDPLAYRRIRRNFLRVHYQFVSANDRRAAYDYFMMVCGPISIEYQMGSPDGAASAIGPDGAHLAPAPGEPAREVLEGR